MRRRGVSQNLHPGSERLKDVYVAGHLVEQTDGVDTILASFAYDTNGTLTSVVLGDPNSGPRYYYAYDAQGNVVDVTDSSGNVVASYSYDAFGALTSSSENFPNGWSNPFRYDGAQGVRYDSETGLYWMSVRAYDPTLGRFISHDPLGRLAKLGLNTQPYVYAGNNPVNYTDPSGMLYTDGQGLIAHPAPRSSSGSGSKMTITVTCSQLHPGESYYNDPRCKAWRAWQNTEKLYNDRMSELKTADRNAWLVAIGGMVLGDLPLLVLAGSDKIEMWLSIAGLVGNALLLLVTKVFDWGEAGTIITGIAHVLLGVVRLLQTLWNAGGWLVKALSIAAIDATPTGAFITTLQILFKQFLGPLFSTIGHGGYATANELDDEYATQKSMSVSQWCAAGYGDGQCAPEAPDATWTVTV